MVMLLWTSLLCYNVCTQSWTLRLFKSMMPSFLTRNGSVLTVS